MTTTPADERERRLASTTFDRNVVVTAGAGTGKTTLLVERCVNLLMRREPAPVRVTELVALTFTNKAANEMKARLRDRLEALARTEAPPPRPAADAGTEEIDALCERYGLTADDVRDRARKALADLERAQIGTIHGFAASLLRLYPLETGLDPGFREGDDRLLRRHFDTSWGLWLDGELSSAGPRTGEWKQVLARFPLEHIGELARGLCAENVELEGIRRAGAAGDPAEVLEGWLADLDKTVTDLIARHPQQRKNEQALAVARDVVRSMRSAPAEAVAVDPDDLSLLQWKPSAVKGWNEDDLESARDVLKAAGALAQVDRGRMDRLCALLTPFARQCRADFTRKGLVTFDGLLVRARDLLRDHPRIREELKDRYKAILVDEFQDTDPLQYEILLWLCEKRSQRAATWRDIHLAPDKLFVVGDPKQSVYGFRGADIEAYLKIIQEVIVAQGGVRYPLTANFRSDSRILDVVNGIFRNLIREEPGLQPEYIALQPGLETGAEATSVRPESSGLAQDKPLGNAQDKPGGASAEQRLGDPAAAPGSKLVRVRRVTAADRKLNAETARRLEAESLARWLDEEILGRASFRDRDGSLVRARPGHVAFLLRALTNVQVYLEALRRRGIGYVVEGERDFYATQEVVDTVNLLRAIDNPHDRLALVGVLRSPLGGHDDVEIYELSRKSLLGYRAAAGHRWVDLPRTTLDLYRRLDRLHREVRFLEAGQAVERVFKELPLSVLAASTGAGQQAVANLDKVRLVAEETSAEGSGTLKDVVAELERRVLDRENEPESPLEEETLDAVRIMSIHRAKGLEFPMVVLVDAMGGTGGNRSLEAEVRRDWATGLTGMRIGELSSLAGVYLDAKRRQREAYERSRLLYVAMTRPRERLVISFAERDRASKAPSDSLLAMLDEATGVNFAQAGPGAVRCDAGEMEVEVVVEDAAAEERDGPPPAPPDADDWTWYEDLWRRRREDWDARRQTPIFLTPTRLKAAGETAEADARQPRATGTPDADGLDRDTALVLGTLAHRVLEHWDFRTERVEEDLDEAVAKHAPALPGAEKQVVLRELKKIWTALTRSEVYDELRSARILGREMPFVMPWDGQVMEGVIDLVYERDGRLYVADYKTDQVADDDVGRIMNDYRHQAEIYTEAVRRGMDREVEAFRLILLRLGRAVDVPPGPVAPAHEP
ncbi:MAG: UvrD-helicase domain-containing protein [Deltaproteobacteria bacterium]|nr:UvrD-helicase domain-containing protein [Deltaproteobacteria bacterium]